MRKDCWISNFKLRRVEIITTMKYHQSSPSWFIRWCLCLTLEGKRSRRNSRHHCRHHDLGVRKQAEHLMDSTVVLVVVALEKQSTTNLYRGQIREIGDEEGLRRIPLFETWFATVSSFQPKSSKLSSFEKSASINPWFSTLILNIQRHNAEELITGEVPARANLL